MKRFFLLLLGLSLLTATAYAQAAATDPSRLTPSARILGMGRAYVGLADSAAAIYLNPAGLANMENWELTSMSGQLLEEFNYVSVTGAYPTDWGTFGIGYDNSSISGCPVTTIEAGTEADPVYIIDTTQPEVSEYSAVAILSYATKGNRLLGFLPEGLAFGVNAKLFSKGLTGDNIRSGAGVGTGTELDLAFHYKTPIQWLDVGSTVQNVLPFAAGGKLSWNGGYAESYPAVMESGAVVRVFGEKDAIRQMGRLKLNLLADFDYYPTLTNYPVVWHYGLEFYPISMICVRSGYDQEAVGDGLGTGMVTVNNFTAGVGLNFGGFKFDYGYHAFVAAPGLTNSFFSLSYSPQLRVVSQSAIPLLVFTPPDKLITFDKMTSVSGEVYDSKISYLNINETAIRFGLKGDFSTTFPLEEGKNKLVFKALDRNRNTLTQETVSVLRLITFPDVPTDYWVARPTSMLAMQRIINGYPNGTFKPEGNISRAEMCALLMRTLTQAPSQPANSALFPPSFTDVSGTHWATKYIDEASELGIVKGYPDGTFRPNGKITRAEGLTMITRFAGIPKQTYANDFPDVKYNYWAAEIIAGGRSAGLLLFLEGQDFAPKQLLTRAETVEMLFRTRTVKDILDNDLLNWDTY